MAGARPVSLMGQKSTSAAEPSQDDNKYEGIAPELNARMKMPNRGLNRVMVSYANRSLPGQGGLPLHGFTVVEGRIPVVETRSDCLPDTVVVGDGGAEKDFHAKVFNFATSFVSYEALTLTDAHIKKIQDAKISDATKKIVASKKGQTYANAVELFKALFFEKFQIKDVKAEAEMESIRLICTEPYIYYRYSPKALDQKEAEWREFARELSNIQDEIDQCGAFAPCPSGVPYTKNDEKTFEKVGPKNIKQTFPGIHPVSVYEMFDLEMRGTRYILDSLAGTCSPTKKPYTAEEKQTLLAGLPVTREETAGQKQARLHTLRQRASYFSYVLYKQDAKTNCNKSTVSFLEAAGKHSQAYQWNRGEAKSDICSATLFSPGSADRMFLWSERNLPGSTAVSQRAVDRPKSAK